MREIKFRGMWDGKWDHATPNDSHWQQFWAASYRETIGQYSGLHDKNGKEVYEGDIVHFSIKGKEKDWRVCAVEWNDDEARFWYDGYEPADTVDTEVIGNIYEHSHLIK